MGRRPCDPYTAARLLELYTVAARFWQVFYINESRPERYILGTNKKPSQKILQLGSGQIEIDALSRGTVLAWILSLAHSSCRGPQNRRV